VLTIVRYETQYTGNLFGQAFGTYEDPYVSLVNEESENGTLRGFGTLRHPNVTAMHLLLTLPLAMALFLTAREARTRWLTGAIFLLGLAGVLATFSRGGILGLLIGGAVVLWGALMTVRRLPHRLAAGVVLAGLLTGFALLVPTYMYTRSGAASVHLNLIETGIRMSQVNPITGTGINNSNPFRRFFGGETAAELRFPIHNYYLLMLVETGFVGFALYFGFFGIMIWKSLRLGRSQDLLTEALGLGLAGGFVALGVQVMVDFPNLDALQMLMWFYAGLIVVLGQLREEAGQDFSDPDGLVRGLWHR
jgi:O-antigen ligase